MANKKDHPSTEPVAQPGARKQESSSREVDDTGRPRLFRVRDVESIRDGRQAEEEAGDEVFRHHHRRDDGGNIGDLDIRR